MNELWLIILCPFAAVAFYVSLILVGVCIVLCGAAFTRLLEGLLETLYTWFANRKKANKSARLEGKKKDV